MIPYYFIELLALFSWKIWFLYVLAVYIGASNIRPSLTRGFSPDGKKNSDPEQIDIIGFR